VSRCQKLIHGCLQAGSPFLHLEARLARLREFSEADGETLPRGIMNVERISEWQSCLRCKVLWWYFARRTDRFGGISGEVGELLECLDRWGLNDLHRGMTAAATLWRRCVRQLCLESICDPFDERFDMRRREILRVFVVQTRKWERWFDDREQGIIQQLDRFIRAHPEEYRTAARVNRTTNPC
jgi:hypothetical protein